MSTPQEIREGEYQGLTRELVLHISQAKNEPEWMKEKRLAAYDMYKDAALPNWGPSLSDLELDKIIYFTDPHVKETNRWEELPDEIVATFDKLGIPKAEQNYLGGVGAQYDSGVVYHRLKQSLAEKGVIFENMDVALQTHEELVKKYFMTDCVPPTDHTFTKLHAAVWSGGTFIYVPKGVKVDMPLQAYFRMNRERSAQFEHTLIIADEGSEITYIEGCSAPQYNASSLHAGCVEIFVLKGAKVRYVSIENWSKNTYNLNTKKAIVHEDATIEWLNGQMGSRVTMLYPSSVLLGDRSQSESMSIVAAGVNQFQDTGSKSIHIGKNTRSIIKSKSIAKDGGVTNYRGFVKIIPKAEGATVSVTCDSLLLDEKSQAHTYPTMKVSNKSAVVVHEARAGKIGNSQMNYLHTRGYDEDNATRLLVRGFFDPVIKTLPLEYALELNRLVELEMDGAQG